MGDYKRYARPKTFAELFAKASPCPNTGCWLWTEALNRKGYGVTTHNGIVRGAHRVLWEIVNGPVPDGMQPDHKCRVRCCINPDHLEVVTPRENVMRGESFMSARARATHCARGHPFDATNTYIPPGRHRRICRTCIKQSPSRQPQALRLTP